MNKVIAALIASTFAVGAFAATPAPAAVAAPAAAAAPAAKEEMKKDATVKHVKKHHAKKVKAAAAAKPAA